MTSLTLIVGQLTTGAGKTGRKSCNILYYNCIEMSMRDEYRRSNPNTGGLGSVRSVSVGSSDSFMFGRKHIHHLTTLWIIEQINRAYPCMWVMWLSSVQNHITACLLHIVPKKHQLSLHSYILTRQLSLVISSWIGAMSTSWGVNAGTCMVRVCVADKTVWSPCYTRATFGRFSNDSL